MFSAWKLHKLKKEIARLLSGPEEVCLWLSGGSDSTLLLNVMLETGKPFSILRFDQGWTLEQRKIVDELTIKHNLRVYSYPPSWSTMVGDGAGELSLISGYAVGSRGETATLFRDIVEGSRCAFDIEMPTSHAVAPPIRFDLHVVGTKRYESHWAIGEHSFLSAKRWDIGDAECIAPLFHWSNGQVVDALRSFGINWQTPPDEKDGGNISACTRCMHGVNDVHCLKTGGPIAAIEWSPQANLAAYHEAVGISRSVL